MTDFGVQKHPFYGETFSPFRSRGRLWRNFSHFERSLNIEWAEKEQATLRPLVSVIVDPLTPLGVIQIPFSSLYREQNTIFELKSRSFGQFSSVFLKNRDFFDTAGRISPFARPSFIPSDAKAITSPLTVTGGERKNSLKVLQLCPPLRSQTL